MKREELSILALIPVRMGSSRFPGKPLHKLRGVTMVERVFRNVSASPLVKRTVIATCDREISECVSQFGADFVLTCNSHERASDRCAEALIKIEERYNEKYDVVVMIQGDEPMVTPEMIEVSLNPFYDEEDIQVVNLCCPISDSADVESPNTIKVVVNEEGFAIYMSRSVIPSNTRGLPTEFLKQVCIIPFRRDFLLKYGAMLPTALEVKESIDMLRVIESGGRVRMVQIQTETFPVDTLEDALRVEGLLQD